MEDETTSLPDVQRAGALIAVLFLLGVTAAAPAAAGPDGWYAEESFTANGRVPTPTVDTDVGTVDCAQNIGGVCLPFPETNESGATGAWIEVTGTTVAGGGVPIQVCLDNNGDDVCGGGTPASGGCEDGIWASHTDLGRFINPIGPLPTDYAEGCPGGSEHTGYVVIVCEALHAPHSQPGHEHVVQDGTVEAYTELEETGPAPDGDFCKAGAPGTVVTSTIPSVPLGLPPVALVGLLGAVAVGLRAARPKR